jgi:hypothetical protein
MLFRKLFQVLVVGGAAMGLTSGCSTPALAQQGGDAKMDTATTKDTADAGTAKTEEPDAGTTSGGGVSGW